MISFTDPFPAIPDELKALPQWVCWRWENRDGKPTKIPYQAHTPEREAKSNDKRTWASFAQAVKAFEQAKRNGHALDGIGFVVTNNDPLVGIDLDKCLNPDTGEIEAWAQEILAAFDSYTEVTPSGKGFRVWLKGRLPPGGRKKGRLEMYSQGRFFTLTGQRLPDKPAEIRDCQQALDALHARAFPKPGKTTTPPPCPAPDLSLSDTTLIEKACKAKNSADFQRLWRGDTAKHGNDHSVADLALCGNLLFWTNGDVGRADQLFRQSGLMRPKWDEKHSGDGRSYGQITLEKALGGFQEGYSGRREHKAAEDIPKQETQPESNTRQESPKEEASAETLDDDYLVPPPTPTEAMLYGLAGDVGRAAAATTEANPYATMMSYLTFLSAMAGRNVYLPIGNIWHHARLYTLHVGRSARGRKGDALSLVHRIRWLLPKDLLGTVHTGGLSSREGLVALIQDMPDDQANADTGALDKNPDKRLWVVESEFSNVLHQAKRDGNTLSAALRDGWDGMDIKPATKHSKTFCTAPHIALSAGITPSELLALIESRELTNGFAGRFLIFWAERLRLEPEPSPTPDEVLDDLVKRTAAVIRFAKGHYPDPNAQDSRRASLTPSARAIYRELYHGELNESLDSELLNALLERRPPMLLRLALLLALTDQTLLIEPRHIEAALAWIRYWRDSVRFIFAAHAGAGAAEAAKQHGEAIVRFLTRYGEADRRTIYRECFNSHLAADKIDLALGTLLRDGRLELREVPRADGNPGKPRKVYRLSKRDNSVLSVHSVHSVGSRENLSAQPCVHSVHSSEQSTQTDLSTLSTQPCVHSKPRANTLSTQSTQSTHSSLSDDDREEGKL